VRQAQLAADMLESFLLMCVLKRSKMMRGLSVKNVVLFKSQLKQQNGIV
jgi:hypothetical protein